VSGATLLLVEDDHDVRDAIVDVLRDEGYELVCASDGQEALDLLRGGLSPALILLDLMMPGMDGFGFRAEQQRDPALSRIPVVVLTADRHAGQRARDLGAEGYLAKPMRLEALISMIRRLADR
jgi:CheY-like chemotaxis protein